MSTTNDPMTTDIQAIISQLQEDKHFGEIGKEWSRKLKSKGLTIIEKIGNAVLRLETQKDNISANQATLVAEKVKSEDCISLLKIIIHMKAKEATKASILPRGDEPLFEWLQSMQFKYEMILVEEEGLK